MSAKEHLQRITALISNGALSRAMREPLLHFLAAGLVLFLANAFFNGAEIQNSGDTITISQGRIQQIAESYRLQAGRLPSEAELQALVEDFIHEEIYYREAVAMGLDADDTIIRRRMRQKLEFLTEDAEASEEPSEEQLTAWLQTHSEAYRFPARISFRHVLASVDTRGANTKADATAFLASLSSGATPGSMGDKSMLPAALPLTTQKGVTTHFGDAFAEKLFEHDKEGWFGPISSPFGAHAVQILSREPARNPPLSEIREKLISDWIEAQRTSRRKAYRDRLRKRYDVSVDWPDAYATMAPAHDSEDAD